MVFCIKFLKLAVFSDIFGILIWLLLGPFENDLNHSLFSVDSICGQFPFSFSSILFFQI